MNEPELQAMYNYVENLGHLSTEDCATTTVCTEVYSVLHNILISHATVSKLYKSKFQVRHILKIACYIYSDQRHALDWEVIGF
jgi:hypothetical protein